MENEISSTNTPSKLRAPKQRKNVSIPLGNEEENQLLIPEISEMTIAHEENEIRRNPAQKPRLESPKSTRNKGVSLPPAIPALVTNERGVKTYRTQASVTNKPAAPYSRVGGRPAPKTAASGKAQLPKGMYSALDSVTLATGARPSWDRKGRLEEMEKMMEDLKKKIENSNQTSTSYQIRAVEVEHQVRSLEEDKKTLQDKIYQRDKDIDNLSETLRKLKKQYQDAELDRENEFKKIKSTLQNEIDEAISKKSWIQSELEKTKAELSNASEENVSLKSLLSKQSIALTETDTQINALKLRIDSLEALSTEQKDKISYLNQQLEEANINLRIANQKLHAGETLRRKLHNIVQELKGNIRVFCRVRPFLSSEIPSNTTTLEQASQNLVISLNEDEQPEIKLIQSAESASGNQISKAYPFTFDKIFNCESTQQDVFEEISQLVQSSLDGYKVCIFAYGQTGSGKTYTMEGNTEMAEKAGMIPRTVQQIFETTEALKEKGWTFQFEASYLEIYNETIRDLLTSKVGNESKYDIKHVDGRTYVTDLTVLPVKEPGEIMSLLKRAASNRAVAETQCNERSSRSHSVFSLKISGENSVTTEKIEGLLHLIDLAGSERLSNSGSTGDRLKETQAINKSLSSLGDVIHAIANKESHIPYRNSKLTYLLQNSLGGNCKTLMFVNISPSLDNLGESLCSLRFATKVNSCQIGTARKNTKIQ